MLLLLLITILFDIMHHADADDVTHKDGGDKPNYADCNATTDDDDKDNNDYDADDKNMYDDYAICKRLYSVHTSDV